MEIQQTEEEVERGIRDSMQKRNIVNMEGYLKNLREQKITKRDASAARVEEAKLEIRVIDRMREGVI